MLDHVVSYKFLSRFLAASLSLGLSIPEPPSSPPPLFSNRSSVASFCKSSDISTAAPLSALNLASVNENSNFIIASLLGQKQGRSI